MTQSEPNLKTCITVLINNTKFAYNMELPSSAKATIIKLKLKEEFKKKRLTKDLSEYLMFYLGKQISEKKSLAENNIESNKEKKFLTIDLVNKFDQNAINSIKNFGKFKIDKKNAPHWMRCPKKGCEGLRSETKSIVVRNQNIRCAVGCELFKEGQTIKYCPQCNSYFCEEHFAERCK